MIVFFLCFLSELINFVTKYENTFGSLILPRIVGKIRQPNYLQKIASTFEGLKAVTLKEGPIIPK